MSKKLLTFMTIVGLLSNSFAYTQDIKIPSMLPDGSNAASGATGMSNPATGATSIVYGDSTTAGSESNNGGILSGGIVIPGGQCAPGVGTGCQVYDSVGYSYWLGFYTDNRINRTWETNNLGVTGDTVLDMSPSGTNGRFAQLQSLIRQSSGAPIFVIWSGGQNDIVAGGETCSQIVTALRSGYAALQAQHAIIIRPGIYNRASPAAFTTTQQKIADCVNEADRRYQEEGNAGFYYIDMSGVINDPASATSAPYSGYLRTDGIHFTQAGGSAYAWAIAQRINGFYPNWRPRNVDPSDLYDAANNPGGNLITNGGFQTTTGGNILGSSGGAGTVAGSWTMGGPGGTSGLTLTSSVQQLAATAGVLPIGSNYEKLVLSGTYTAGVSLGAGSIFQFACNGNCASIFSAGDTVEACAAIRLGNNGTNTNLMSINIAISFSDNGVSANYTSGNAVDNQTYLPATGFVDSAQNPAPFHYMCAPRYTIKTPLSFLSVSLGPILGAGSASTGAGEMDVGAVSFRKINF